MTDNLVIITVKTEGPTGSGKSIALRLIEEALNSKFLLLEAFLDEGRHTATFTAKLEKPYLG